MRLALEVVGIPETIDRIESGVARMQIAAFQQMGVSMNELRNYTVKAHMDGTGPTSVAHRTGNLARSATVEVTEDTDSVMGELGFGNSTTAPYARILELGGTTREHVIRATPGKTLAFMMHGQMTFRKQVNHPGSKFPARPYLQTALEEQKAQIINDLARAMEASV